MQNSIMMFTLSVFDRKYPFLANLVQKVKIISWNWNLVPTLIWICLIQCWCSIFLFLIGNMLFGQICSKKLKLSVQGETRYLNSFKYAELNSDVHFFRFQPEISCLGQFGPKNQNSQLKVKLDTQTNSNMQNLMMLFNQNGQLKVKLDT